MIMHILHQHIYELSNKEVFADNKNNRYLTKRYGAKALETIKQASSYYTILIYMSWMAILTTDVSSAALISNFGKYVINKNERCHMSPNRYKAENLNTTDLRC